MPSTVLREFGGRQLCGDPESLLGAALEDEAGGDAGTAVEVFLAAGQAQVESVVTEGRVLTTLKSKESTREEVTAGQRITGGFGSFSEFPHKQQTNTKTSPESYHLLSGWFSGMWT